MLVLTWLPRCFTSGIFLQVHIFLLFHPKELGHLVVDHLLAEVGVVNNFE